MIKKLIALVEALMIVSIFCIGFASWSILDPNGEQFDPLSGSVQTQGVQDVSLTSIGFYNAQAQTGFDYSLSGSTATFSKTTITVEVEFLKSNIEQLAYTDAYQLFVNCDNPNGDKFDIFSSGSTWLTPPTFATAHLQGFPNQKVIGNIKTATAQTISAGFPVKSTSQLCLYNLITKSTAEDYAVLVFTFDFAFPATLKSEYVRAICWTPYTLSFKIGKA